MKFFLDCNHYSQLRVSFEGLKESTGFLNVRGFVRLKYRHSSHGVGWCSAGRVVLRHNHHPQVGADGERKRKRQSDAFLPYQDSTQRTRGDEALMEISRVTTTHSSHACTSSPRVTGGISQAELPFHSHINPPADERPNDECRPKGAVCTS